MTLLTLVKKTLCVVLQKIEGLLAFALFKKTLRVILQKIEGLLAFALFKKTLGGCLTWC